MNIETFEIEEHDDASPQVEAEAVELIKALKLEGQESLVVKEAKVPLRIQYPEMTEQELVVYEALFPTKTPVQKYSAGIMPVRVLQVVAHAQEQFERVEVWHKKVRDPDPILVGWAGQQYRQKPYLLARWGEALQPFKALVDEARTVIRERWTSRLKHNIAQMQGHLNGVDALVEEKLSGAAMYVAGTE